MPTRKQRFEQFKKNPELEMFKAIVAMEEKIDAKLEGVEEKVTKGIAKDPTLLNAIMTNAVGKIHSIKKGQQGDAGATPVRGKDYYTEADKSYIISFVQSRIRVPKDGKNGADGQNGRDGRDGSDGYTPVAGVDYPTKEQLGKMISDGVYTLFSNKKDKKTVSKEEVANLIGKLQEKVDFKERASEIARALETLTGGNKLDYKALKNTPSIPKDGGGKIYARGGGSEVKYYDLSASCDGSTKTFTVPTNKRIVGVFGTDFPTTYRPTVDWTGSGTTTLTLTAEVDAPTSGSTLFIIYVPR